MSRRPLLLLLALFIVITLAGCDVDLGEVVVIRDGPGILRTPRVPDLRQEGDWYEIFFTDPTCPPLAQRNGGLDAIIASDLLQAEHKVDMAAFDLDAEPIVDALIELHRRGAAVRVMIDVGNAGQASIDRLRLNGVAVATDSRTSFMHNKFIVIDERILWTGSLNYTSNGAYCNNNNAVRFDVPLLAENYTVEFEEMFEEQQLGPTSPATTPHRQLLVNDVLIETFFGPEERIAPALATLIASAEQEILFLAFSFTYEEIGEAMLAQAQRGVIVRGVFETTGSGTPFSYYGLMSDARLPTVEVRTDGNPRIMHHKVLVIDREVVVFGSFNFSASANNSNDENMLIVYDAVFSGYFVEEFDFVWNEASS